MVTIETDEGKYIGDPDIFYGKKNGEALFIFKDINEGRYKGNYENGKRTGEGTQTLKNGDVLFGKFENGTFKEGTYTCASNGDILKGKFENGTFKEGTYFSNGNEYTGTFVDDNLEGEGSFKLRDGDVYVGNFKKGLFEGKGTLTQNGNTYVGDFKEGKYHGHGVINYVNGETYDGYFVNDLRQGEGKATYPNKDEYEGIFVNDLRQGEGTYNFSNGDKFIGWFNNNKPTEGEYFIKKGEEKYVFEDEVSKIKNMFENIHDEDTICNYFKDKTKEFINTLSFATSSSSINFFLEESVKKEKLKIIQTLLEKGIEPYNDETYLISKTENYEIQKLLAEKTETKLVKKIKPKLSYFRNKIILNNCVEFTNFIEALEYTKLNIVEELNKNIGIEINYFYTENPKKIDDFFNTTTTILINEKTCKINLFTYLIIKKCYKTLNYLFFLKKKDMVVKLINSDLNLHYIINECELNNKEEIVFFAKVIELLESKNYNRIYDEGNYKQKETLLSFAEKQKTLLLKEEEQKKTSSKKKREERERKERQERERNEREERERNEREREEREKKEREERERKEREEIERERKEREEIEEREKREREREEKEEKEREIYIKQKLRDTIKFYREYKSNLEKIKEADQEISNLITRDLKTEVDKIKKKIDQSNYSLIKIQSLNFKEYNSKIDEIKKEQENKYNLEIKNNNLKNNNKTSYILFENFDCDKFCGTLQLKVDFNESISEKITTIHGLFPDEKDKEKNSNLFIRNFKDQNDFHYEKIYNRILNFFTNNEKSMRESLDKHQSYSFQDKETFLNNIIFLSEPLVYLIKSFFDKSENNEQILEQIKKIFGFSHFFKLNEHKYLIYFKICFSKVLQIWQLCDSDYKYNLTNDGFSRKIIKKSKNKSIKKIIKRSKKKSIRKIIKRSNKKSIRKIIKKSKKKSIRKIIKRSKKKSIRKKQSQIIIKRNKSIRKIPKKE
jgi:hypothetical protein